MKQTGSLLTVLCIIAMTMTHCKKGDTGPAGPPGTANVTYSEWFTPNPYIKDTVFGVWGFKYNKSAPAITQQVLDSGTVLTFGKLLGYSISIWPANVVQQLPIQLTYNVGNVTTDTWSARLTPGNLQIRFVNDRNTYTSIATLHQFRYIIIPGGTKGARVAQRTYEEICREYHIPE
ncbi:hypothetical protein HB364_29515 [Pseudoflavitalea sp. X16]|uniref:hypothetical protein n=1 Tax=Paraflavitalea devenefica TaxID=2716334 RepID=UPI00141E645C|nr:hypothetical protein [Paraflavitalea devenefica]NII29254.1 hypothetical protein [Paraflavitalea devenefica]